MKNQKVCVIGGGAAGLIAAIFAAREHASVLLLEQNEKPGKKILVTGNGKCNLTNRYQDPSCYRGTHPEFAWQVTHEFTMQNTVAFFTKLGIYTKNKNGYLYPASGQASSVLEVLEAEARHLKVKIKCREQVVELQETPENPEGAWTILTKTWHYEADKVILACGSPASEIPGACTSGYELAQRLGHTLVEPLPALVPLTGKGNYFSGWAGVRVEGTALLQVDGEIVAGERGELQLTEYGISGIPVFQISTFAVRALKEKKKVSVILDFMPEFDLDTLKAFLQGRLEDCPYKSLKESLTGLFPKKLIDVLMTGKPDLDKLAEKIKAFPLEIKSSRPLKQAQICSGGVSTEEICPETMESKKKKGLYFAGEMVDVDGICGGYNLQWAWSSGAVAGRSAANPEED